MDNFENIWPIHVEFTLTREEIAQYYRSRYARAKLVSILLTAVYAVLFVFLCVFFKTYNNIPLYLFLLLFAVLAVYYVTKAPRETRKALETDALLTNPQIWDIEFPSITVTEQDGTKHVILWKEFFSYTLTKDQVAYFVSPKRVLILPRRLLTYDQTKTLVTHSTNTILL